MFARSVAIALLALPILASATSFRRGGPSGSVTNSCNTGTLQCCNDVQDTNNLDQHARGLLDYLHVDVGSLTGKVGVTCNPVTVVGDSGTSCSVQPACCTNTSFNGVVAIGCSPSVINT